jgi:predicted ester cyclase
MPARRIPRSIYEDARDVARGLAKTKAFEQSRRYRKKIEMLFHTPEAHSAAWPIAPSRSRRRAVRVHPGSDCAEPSQAGKANAAPDMLLKYSLHEPRRGRDDIKAFMTDFRAAFPDLNFWGTADLIAEGDYVVGQWEGGGTHTGPAFKDFLIGGLPAATGRKMHFTGTTVLKVLNGRIAEEVGLDDGVTALTQIGLIKVA